MKRQHRFDDLTIVLQYDNYGEKRLTDFDRMFIHKERSAIIGGTNYQVPDDVENKIKEILHIVERLEWENPM